MAVQDDLQLIRLTQTGNTSAFCSIVLRYQQPLFRFVGNLVADRHATEDLVQEVFLTAYRKLDSYDPSRATLTTWLFTIARNQSINHLRRARRSTTNHSALLDDIQSAPTDSRDVEVLQQLDRALQELPIHQRTAFVLAELEQLPYDTIARIEETQLGTIKSRVHRAKEKLRRILQRTWEPTDVR